MKNKKGDDWFPMWGDKWIFGSTRIELEPAERSVWVDFMALGSKDDGYIRANESTPYPHSQLAGFLNISIELLETTLKKCLSHKPNELPKLTEEPKGIYRVTKWENYELSQRHKRRLELDKRERGTAKTDIMSPKTDINIEIKKNAPPNKILCPICKGKGEVGGPGYQNTCPTCKGAKLIWRTDAEELKKAKV